MWLRERVKEGGRERVKEGGRERVKEAGRERVRVRERSRGTERVANDHCLNRQHTEEECVWERACVFLYEGKRASVFERGRQAGREGRRDRSREGE